MHLKSGGVMVFVLSHASIRQDEASGGNVLRTVSSTDIGHASDVSKVADNAKEQEKKLNKMTRSGDQI